MEGDLRLLVTGPGGVRRLVTGAGGQPDTGLRQVTLRPGQQLMGSVNLLHTDAGATFPEVGSYILQAEYIPSPQLEWITSPPVTLPVRAPQTDAERGAAALLQKEEARLALTLAEADRSPVALQELAQHYSDTTGGKLARLILAGSVSAPGDAIDSDNIFLATDPMSVASLITSVSTPFSGVGDRLKQDYVAHIESQDTAAKATGSTSSSDVERALLIVKGQPLESEG